MRGVVSSLLIVLGLFVVASGVGAQWGAPAGLIAAGLVCVVLGALVHGVGEGS